MIAWWPKKALQQPTFKKNSPNSDHPKGHIIRDEGRIRHSEVWKPHQHGMDVLQPSNGHLSHTPLLQEDLTHVKLGPGIGCSTCENELVFLVIVKIWSEPWAFQAGLRFPLHNQRSTMAGWGPSIDQNQQRPRKRTAGSKTLGCFAGQSRAVTPPCFLRFSMVFWHMNHPVIYFQDFCFHGKSQLVFFCVSRHLDTVLTTLQLHLDQPGKAASSCTKITRANPNAWSKKSSFHCIILYLNSQKDLKWVKALKSYLLLL